MGVSLFSRVQGSCAMSVACSRLTRAAVVLDTLYTFTYLSICLWNSVLIRSFAIALPCNFCNVEVFLVENRFIKRPLRIYKTLWSIYFTLINCMVELLTTYLLFVCRHIWRTACMLLYDSSHNHHTAFLGYFSSFELCSYCFLFKLNKLLDSFISVFRCLPCHIPDTCCIPLLQYLYNLIIIFVICIVGIKR